MGSIFDPVAGVDRAFLYIFGFAFALLAFITILMIYFVVRFRASRNPVPADIRGNTLLEVVWMIIPTLIALSMFYVGWQSYLGLRNVPEDAIVIDTTGQMFSWTFRYPNGKESESELVVPEGKAVKLNITSEDVLHSLEDVLLGSEGHFDVKLIELTGGSVRSGILVPKARSNLEIPIEPGNHHELLELLGRLR